MCVHFFNFDHLRITLQSLDLIWGIKFCAPSPSTHLLLSSSSYPWLPMVVSLFFTHLLLEVASPIIFLPSPFRFHWTSRSKGLHWWRRSKAYKLNMELHQCIPTELRVMPHFQHNIHSNSNPITLPCFLSFPHNAYLSLWSPQHLVSSIVHIT